MKKTLTNMELCQNFVVINMFAIENFPNQLGLVPSKFCIKTNNIAKQINVPTVNKNSIYWLKWSDNSAYVLSEHVSYVHAKF